MSTGTFSVVVLAVWLAAGIAAAAVSHRRLRTMAWRKRVEYLGHWLFMSFAVFLMIGCVWVVAKQTHPYPGVVVNHVSNFAVYIWFAVLYSLFAAALACWIVAGWQTVKLFFRKEPLEYDRLGLYAEC